MYIMPWFLNAPRSTRWTLQCGPITIPTREPALCTSRTVWMEAPHMLSLGWGEETSQLTWFREPHLLDLWLEFAVHCRVSSWDILYLCSTCSQWRSQTRAHTGLGPGVSNAKVLRRRVSTATRLCTIALQQYCQCKLSALSPTYLLR